MYLENVSLLSRRTPRYLTEGEQLIVLFLILSLLEKVLGLLVKMMADVFRRFMIIFHSSKHGWYKYSCC
jgi:hypothetical protein